MLNFYFKYDKIFPSKAKLCGVKLILQAKDGKNAMNKLREEVELLSLINCNMDNVQYFGRRYVDMTDPLNEALGSISKAT
jgi:hypothetical protein